MVLCAVNDVWRPNQKIPLHLYLIGVPVALLGPLVLAWLLRRRDSWKNMVAAVWVLLASLLPDRPGPSHILAQLAPYVWCGVGALGLIAWGLDERRREHINLGIAGFGLTVLVFYFSEVMDKLDRSVSLIGLGLLFLLLAWFLEKTRRQLVARVRGAA